MNRLRVLVGTSLDALEPITDIVNTGESRSIRSDRFEGKVVMYINKFMNSQGGPSYCEYFEREDRRGITWSIQVQGRFLQPHSANDILFGNTFDRPLKLPWGSSAALQFMRFIDPALDHDLKSNKPWALSPLIATVPHFVHARTDVLPDEVFPESEPFPPSRSIQDDTSQLDRALLPDPTEDTNHSKRPDERGVFRFRTPGERRMYFSKDTNRNALVFGPNDLISIDFCYGFLEFSPSLALRLPGGITFDLMKYWDRQPVRFVCCERKKSSDNYGDDDGPIGKLFWCISVELVDDEVVENVDTNGDGEKSHSLSMEETGQGVTQARLDDWNGA